MIEYHKTICIVFDSESYYQDCINDKDQFKAHLLDEFEKHPELFPQDFKNGWKLNGFSRASKKTVC